MTVRFRIPKGPVVCIQILFLLFALALTWDAYDAFHHPDLYPFWTNNPDAIAENYAHLNNYLKSEILLIAIVFAAIFISFFIDNNWISIATMFLFVYALGHGIAMFLPPVPPL